MTLRNLYAHLLFSVFVLNLIACSSFQAHVQPSSNKLSTLNETQISATQLNTAKVNQVDWLAVFNLSQSQRTEALNTFTFPPANKQDILKHAILLTHTDASFVELQEAEQLIKHNTVLESSGSVAEDEHLAAYILKLNQFLQKRKLETIALQEQIAAYKRLLKKQGHKNKVLENKIEALTDIEHRINLRPNKNMPELSK